MISVRKRFAKTAILFRALQTQIQIARIKGASAEMQERELWVVVSVVA